MSKIRMIKIVLTAALFMSLPFLYNSCGSPTGGGKGSSTNGSASFSSACDTELNKVFQATYYPFVRTWCAGCHSSARDPVGARAHFADADPFVAYNSFIRVSATAQSNMNSVNHQGGYSKNSIAANPDTILTPLSNSWSVGESTYIVCKGGTPPPDKYTVSKTVTPALPATANVGENLGPVTNFSFNTATEMSPSSGINHPGLFEMSVRTFLTVTQEGVRTTGYYFSNPRYTNNGTTAALIRGVGLRIDGVRVTSGQTFYASQRYVPNLTGNNRRTLGATGAIPLYRATSSGTPPVAAPLRVEVAFSAVGTASIDFQPPGYANLIAAGGALNTCLACHNTGGANANNITISNLANIAAIITLTGNGISGTPGIVKGSPESSGLFRHMNGIGSVMPPAGLRPQAERDRLRDWILDGAPLTQPNQDN